MFSKILSALTQKTTWAGIGGVAAGVALCTQGHIDTGILAIISGVQTIFVRQAIAKVGQ